MHQILGGGYAALGFMVNVTSSQPCIAVGLLMSTTGGGLCGNAVHKFLGYKVHPSTSNVGFDFQNNP